jgi:hypothetical protein
LHYLDGKLDIELCLPASARPANDAQESELLSLYRTVEDMAEIRGVVVYFRSAQ